MTTLSTLLDRGDYVAIEGGQLVIKPASGKVVPKDWLKENAKDLIFDCLKATDTPAYTYQSHKTVLAGSANRPAVTLQFVNILTGQKAYAAFNANLKRQRNSRYGNKGEFLPKGQFYVGKQSAFAHFWLRAGLGNTKRYYDRMGKLEGLVFAAQVIRGEKLENASIKPLETSYDQLITTTKERLSSDQGTTKPRLSTATKETPQPPKTLGLEQDLSAGEISAVKGLTVQQVKGNVIPVITNPIEQSVDEWLQDYDQAKPLKESNQ